MQIPKKTPLLILGITSIICSRTMFWFFNDPEGPNLLIVMGMAAILYAISLPAYLHYPFTKQNGLRKLVSLIFIQAIIVTSFYFLSELVSLI